MPYNFAADSFHTGVMAEALRAKIYRKSEMSLKRSHFDLIQNFRYKGSPPPIIFAPIVRPMNVLQLCPDSFHTGVTAEALRAKIYTKKTKQICFCQNFVKFPPISIIFGRKMENDPNICEVHSFSTSPNLRYHLTVLNANVPNCYITPKLLVIDRSHWQPQFIRGRRTFRDHSNFKQFVHI